MQWSFSVCMEKRRRGHLECILYQNKNLMATISSVKSSTCTDINMCTLPSELACLLVRVLDN